MQQIMAAANSMSMHIHSAQLPSIQPVLAYTERILVTKENVAQYLVAQAAFGGRV